MKPIFAYFKEKLSPAGAIEKYEGFISFLEKNKKDILSRINEEKDIYTAQYLCVSRIQLISLLNGVELGWLLTKNGYFDNKKEMKTWE